MKVGIATTLSIAGVLAAGAAAFAVNTSVLTSSTSATTAAIASDANLATTQLAQPVTNQQVKEASVSSTPVSDKVTTYQVGSSGSVVIDTTSGAIVVTNVVPAAGWTSEPARADANGDVKVHFISGSTRIEFLARMSGGIVSVEVRTEQNQSALAPLGTTPSAAPGAPTAKPSYGNEDDDRNKDHDDDRSEVEHEDGDDD